MTRPSGRVLALGSDSSIISVLPALICCERQINCVVLDLDMDEASGFEVLLSLVPDREHRENAVVVLTRLINPTLHELAVEYGAQACLVKRHTSPQLLHQAIQTAIASVHSHAH